MKLHLYGLLGLALSLVSLVSAASDDQLKIGVKYKPDDCPIKTRKGDKLSMQWASMHIKRATS